MNIGVIHEDKDLIVVNPLKAEVVVHPGAGNKRWNLGLMAFLHLY